MQGGDVGVLQWYGQLRGGGDEMEGRRGEGSRRTIRCASFKKASMALSVTGFLVVGT